VNLYQEVSVRVTINGVDFSEGRVFAFHEPLSISTIMPAGGLPFHSGGSISLQLASSLGVPSSHEYSFCKFAGGAAVSAEYQNGTVACNAAPQLSAREVGVEISLNGQQYTLSGLIFGYSLVLRTAVPVRGPSAGGTDVWVAVDGIDAAFHNVSGVRCRFGKHVGEAYAVDHYRASNRLATLESFQEATTQLASRFAPLFDVSAAYHKHDEHWTMVRCRAPAAVQAGLPAGTGAVPIAVSVDGGQRFSAVVIASSTSFVFYSLSLESVSPQVAPISGADIIVHMNLSFETPLYSGCHPRSIIIRVYCEKDGCLP